MQVIGVKVYNERVHFDTNIDDNVIMTVFGSCLGNGQDNPAGGIGVFFIDDNPLNISRPAMRATNQAAILESVLTACRIISLSFPNRQVIVYHNSEYVENCVERGIPEWKRNGWRTSKNKPVKNQDLLKALDGILQSEHHHI